MNQIKDAVAILRLDKEKIASVATRSDATKWGIIILAVAPLFNVLLSSLVFSSGYSEIFRQVVLWKMLIPSMALVGSIFAMSFVAERFFKAGNFHIQFFNVLAYASIVLWLSSISFLLDFIGLIYAGRLFDLLWSVGLIAILVVAYTFLVHYKHLAQKDAALTIVGGVLAYFLLQQILGNVLVGRNYYTIF